MKCGEWQNLDNKKPESLEPKRRDDRAPQFGDIKEKQWHKIRLYGLRKVLNQGKKNHRGRRAASGWPGYWRPDRLRAPYGGGRGRLAPMRQT